MVHGARCGDGSGEPNVARLNLHFPGRVRPDSRLAHLPPTPSVTSRAWPRGHPAARGRGIVPGAARGYPPGIETMSPTRRAEARSEGNAGQVRELQKPLLQGWARWMPLPAWSAGWPSSGWPRPRTPASSSALSVASRAPCAPCLCWTPASRPGPVAAGAWAWKLLLLGATVAVHASLLYSFPCQSGRGGPASTAGIGRGKRRGGLPIGGGAGNHGEEPSVRPGNAV